MLRARAEQVAEEIVGILRCAAAAAIFETVAGVRARPDFVTILETGAEGIECCPLFRVLENLIGLADFLEARFGVGFLVQVRMELARELAMGGLDLRLGRRSRNAHDGVIVLVFHGFPYRPIIRPKLTT